MVEPWQILFYLTMAMFDRCDGQSCYQACSPDQRLDRFYELTRTPVARSAK